MRFTGRLPATCDTDALPSAFAQRVEREARRRGFYRARRRVVLGDGAPWIWNLAAELFPGAIEIVDRFHAKGHLSDVAKAIWGPASDLGSHWATKRHEELDAGDLDAILAALKVHSPTNDEARKCMGYLQ
ncbi:MAG TPA: ISKra4 family transposase, partial [Thermoanaerobaculia bacterium]|nr:ISKra4 family transposase [Thermoanaerobaculia bacterium]